MLSKKQFLAYWDGGMVGGDREKWGWAVMFMQRGACWPQPKLGKAKLYIWSSLLSTKKTFSFSHWSVQLEEICCRHLELSNKVNLTPLWKSPTTKIKDCHLWKRPHQQILNQYRTNIEQILNQYWTNIRQIPNKYQTIIKASEAHSPVKAPPELRIA